MSFSLPNPTSPNTNDSLTSLPIRQNFQAIAAALNSLDGSDLVTNSVQENALATGVDLRQFLTNVGSNFIVSGFQIVSFSGLSCTLPAGIAYINGYWTNFGGATVTVNANQDTYIDLSPSGQITNVSVANNATAGMPLTTGAIRLAKIVSNGSVIVQVLQSTFNVTPVSPNTGHWFGFDPLGNPVCNADPFPTMLGYAHNVIDWDGTNSGAVQQVNGLSTTIIVPPNNVRNLRISAYTRGLSISSGAFPHNATMSLWDGGVGSGTQIQDGNVVSAAAFYATGQRLEAIVQPTPGSIHTYNVGAIALAGDTVKVSATGTAPAFVKVELD